MSSGLDWDKFVEVAKAAGVEDDTIDVLDAEGYADEADDLFEVTMKELRELNLEPGQPEKTLAAICSLNPKVKQRAEKLGLKPASDAKKTQAAPACVCLRVSPVAANRRNDADKEDKYRFREQYREKGNGRTLLFKLSFAVGFVLGSPEEKKNEEKRSKANKALADVNPSLQRLAALANKLPKDCASVVLGVKQVIQSAQTLLQIVGTVAGSAPDEAAKQTLTMILERFEGSVSYLKLATAGNLTDTSTTKLMAAVAKGVEDRLMDTVNSCKRFQMNSQIIASDQKIWSETTQAMWVAVKGSLETLKHLARMIMQTSSRKQLIDAIQGSKVMIETLLEKGKFLDWRGFSIIDFKPNATRFLGDLSMFENAVDCAESEKAASSSQGGKLREKSRQALAKSLFLASAATNVCLAVPELKSLSSATRCVQPALKAFQDVLAQAVKDPKSVAAHTTILRKAAEVGKLVGAMASEAEKAVPVVRKVGDTTNLERRISDAKTAFGEVKTTTSA
eukprot:jgi/Bigna1/89327/estExt_fgenesh1_pg.C_470061